ncbi:MAG: FtsX-like permease family protein [Saprospiraceae bacterium]|nr:FtsX-like permease family protein [Saprospiraceae bacterium]
MNLIKLSWKNITHKPLNMLLSVVLLALGSGLISFLLLLNTQLEDKFEKNLAGVDLVIGAKGSPLQLILCGMYHIDAPTGNIKLKDARPFLNPKHPLIGESIPLSLGDSYQGYRIVGTVAPFIDLYNAKLAEGNFCDSDFEVCIGANVAEALSLHIGSSFQGSHGLVTNDEADHTHNNVPPFKVVGILKPTGTVIDQLILTTNPTFWHLHQHHDEDSNTETHDSHAENANEESEHNHDHESVVDSPSTPNPDSVSSATTHDATSWITGNEDKEITLILVKFRNRNFQTLSMQRNINENTDLQAANPAIEINRLYLMMGVGTDLLKVIAYLIMLVSGLSVFISLYNSLKERKYELALMRVMGASRFKVFKLIVWEGAILAIIGTILGLLMSHIGMDLLAGYLKNSYRYSFTGNTFLREEFYLFIACIVIGKIAAAIPAWQAVRADISKILSKGS